MSFWKLNKWKVARIWLAIFIPFVLFSLATNKGKKAANPAAITLVIMAFATYVAGMTTISGTLAFRTLRKMTEDTSERSILPLLDDGYTVTLKNENRKIHFTREQLNATISGFPVNITFNIGGRSPSCVVFTFYDLYLPEVNKIFTRMINFDVNFKRHLKRDIKPDVLEFVNGLKEKGYTVYKKQ